MKTKSTEKIQDIETYNIKIGSNSSTKVYKIYVNFDTEEVTGAMYDYGFCQKTLDTAECLELLETMIQYNRPMKRDMTNIRDNVKKNKNI